MRFTSLIIVLILLTACGSSPSSVLPPVELTPIDNKINIARLWKFKIGDGVRDFYLKLKPVFNNDTGYVIDHKGYLISFDAKTGALIWDKQLNTSVSAGLTYADGFLFFGNSKGEVIAFNTRTGKESWRAQLSSEVLSAPVFSNGILVVKSIDGAVYGLDAVNGLQRWIYTSSVPQLTLRGNSSPVISNDIVIVATDSGKLMALSLSQGKLLWDATIAIAKGRNQLERIIDIDVEPQIVADVIYVASYQGRIAAVKISSGELIWSRDFSTYSGLVVDAFRVYATDSMGQVWALNRFNGSTLWRQDKLLRRQLTAPATQDKYLVVGDYDGYLHWLTREDGKIIARKRMNSSDVIIPDEEIDKETEMLFSKWNNILVKPVVMNDVLISLDRVGHLDAFRIEKN